MCRVVVWSGDKIEQKMVRKGTVCQFEGCSPSVRKLREARACWATRSRATSSRAQLQPEATWKGLLWSRAGKRQPCWKVCVIHHTLQQRIQKEQSDRAEGPCSTKLEAVLLAAKCTSCKRTHGMQDDWFLSWQLMLSTSLHYQILSSSG